MGIAFKAPFTWRVSIRTASNPASISPRCNHCDKGPRAAFERLVVVAIDEKVAALLIAGDLFDGQVRSARTAAFLAGQLSRLREAGILVYLIKGNHDAESPVTGAVDMPDNVHVFTARGGKHQLSDEVWIHGVSFKDRHEPNSLLDRFDAPVAGAINIAMLHTSLAGAPGHDPYAPCTVAELSAMGFDYWALGHVHLRQIHATTPWIVMPGTPQGRDIGEAGRKSATMLTIQDGRIEIEEVPTSGVTFEHRTIVLGADVETDDEIRAAMRDTIMNAAEACQDPAGVIRLHMTGAPERHWQILRDRDVWTETAREIARETGRLWLDKLVLDLAAPDAARDAGSALSELGTLMGDVRGEEAFASDTEATLGAVLGAVPAEVRARVAPDEEAARAFAARCAAAGAEMVRARLGGVGR
ncbi:metallophosphoesterase family protein [Citreimonas salinaria]|nr:DNA repair exonuclease [Citreimonas salinaria]